MRYTYISHTISVVAMPKTKVTSKLLFRRRCVRKSASDKVRLLWWKV